MGQHFLMTNRDYTQEVGLKSGTPRVAWPIAVVVLAVCGAGLTYGALRLNALPSKSSAHVVEAHPQPAAKSLARNK